MELAIIIPYYKIDFFEEGLKSLAAQTNKNFKVYIGDDASPEDPSDIIEHYKNSLNLVYHRFSENLGGTALTQQWHRCINLSAGERWLMILGDDDYISENYIEEFYKNLEEVEELDIKVIRFASRIVRSPSGKLSKLYTHPKIEGSTHFVYRRYFGGSRGSLTEQIFRRDMFLKYGFIDIPLGWGADIFAWLQFSEFGDNYNINAATAFFRISDINISRGGYMEEKKADARINFFSNYLLNWINAFEPKHRLKFILLFEQILYYNKKLSFHYLFQISVLLIKENNILQLLKFFKRLYIYLIKNRTFYSASSLIKNSFSSLKLKLYRLSRLFFRQIETWQKTEFERRIWKRQQLLFGGNLKKDLSNFRLFRSDDYTTWKNSNFWQRRLENKLNAKEFVLKTGVEVARKIWTGREEDFKHLNFSMLPENFIIKPVRGEASKNVFLISGSYSLFDKKRYSCLELKKEVSKLFQQDDITEILIEEFLPDENGEFLVPNDYRFYMFNGKLVFIQLDKRKSFEKDRVSFYDEDWNLIKKKVLVDAVTDKFESAPKCLNEMIIQAKTLSKHYKNFVRIDFYATNRGAVFGEFTPTPRKGKTLTKFGNRELIRAWDTHCEGMV